MSRIEDNEKTSKPPLPELTERDLRAMVDSSPDGMLLANEHGVILSVNRVMGTMFGYEHDELVGRNVELLIPERLRRIHTAHRTRYRAAPASRSMGSGLDLWACNKNGDEFPVEVSLSPIKTDDGLRVVATVRDISARLAVDAHTHAVFHTIDAAHDAVFMFSVDSLQFTYANQGASAQVGYSCAELLEMSPIHLKPEYTETSFRQMLAPLIAGRVESHVFTTVHRRKDGSDVPVEISLEYPSPSDPNGPRLMVAVVRDITQRLRAERAVHQQEIRLQVLEERERVARDLHDVVIQRLFATGMGLQAVRHLATEPQLATRIAESVEQLDEAISELRSAIFGLTTVPITVADQVFDRIDDAATALGHRPALNITGDVESITPEVLDELLPTLTEALSNIARHAQATETTVELAVDDGQVSLVVTDNGAGFDPGAPRGHGLSNMETRAQRLGGTTTIFSAADGGTTLTWTAAGPAAGEPGQPEVNRRP